jgi:hypothetical protein
VNASSGFSRSLPGIIFAVIVFVAAGRMVVGMIVRRNEAAARAAAQQREAEEQARLAQAALIAERPRVEREIAGQWDGSFGGHSGARLRVTVVGATIDAVLYTEGVRETFRGEFLEDNRLLLTPVDVTRLSGGPLNYSPDTVWLTLASDGNSVNGSYTDAGRRSGGLHMTRQANADDAEIVSPPAEQPIAEVTQTTDTVSTDNPPSAAVADLSEMPSAAASPPAEPVEVPVETTVAPAAPVAAITESPVEKPLYAGTWRGDVRQRFAPAYSVVMKLDAGEAGSRVGSVEYPELHCTGSLRLLDANRDRVRLAEQIESGRCVDGGIIILSLTGDETGEFDWLDRRGRSIATAHLIKGNALRGTTIRTGTTITSGTTIRTGTQY